MSLDYSARMNSHHHPSARVEANLISTTGMLSNASTGPIFTRLRSISHRHRMQTERAQGRAAAKTNANSTRMRLNGAKGMSDMAGKAAR